MTKRSATREPGLGLTLGATALVIGSMVAGCGGDTQPAASGFDPNNCSGGTLHILDQGQISNLDPARLYTSGGGNIPSLLFRTLTTRARRPGQAGLTAVPDLATDTGEPNSDATVWTYHLRPGVKFQDGSPITARDVKYGVEREFAPNLSGGAPYLHDWLIGAATYPGPYRQPAGLASIETPDSTTIVFHLTRPHGDFPYLAAETQFVPVPRAKDTGTDYTFALISSGPYQVKSYEPSKSLVLIRNPAWSRQVDGNRLACPDEIDVTSGLDPTVINQRIESGIGADADAVTADTSIGPAQLAQLDTTSTLGNRIAKGRFPDTAFLTYDTTKSPFTDLRVREALAYAVNRQSVIDAVGGSQLATPATTFLPDSPRMGYQPYDDFPAGPTGNPAKARQLLAAAGYPNGLKLTLAYPAGTQQGAIAAALQDAFGKAGITIVLQAIGSDTYGNVIGTPTTQPQLAFQDLGADWPAGGTFMIPSFDGRQYLTGGGNINTAHLIDPGVDAEIDQINRITDPTQAAARWGALDTELGKRALYLPLYHPTKLVLFGKNVKNAFVSDWTGIFDVTQLSVK